MRKLPKGWAQKTVDELFDVQLGKMLNEIAKAGASQFPYLTNTNVQWARFRLDDLNQMHFSPKEREKFSLKTGDLVVCEGGEVGRCAIWKNEISPCYFQKALHRLRPKEPTKIISEYMLAYMRFIAGTKLLGDLTSQSSIAHLTREKFLELAVNLPPLPEQQKIADILGTWDEALEKLDALIAAKARRKQALMQQLLTGHRRLPGSGAPVNFIRASGIFTNRTERNSRGAPILSVTQDQGVVVRATLERKIAYDIETNDTYKVVEPGDYIISLRSFQGGLEYSEILGAVSPAYHVIHPIKDIDREFYRHYFKSADFVSRLAVAVIGIRDGKQISFTDFGFIKLPYPHIEDQKRIGQLLSTADAELRLLRQQGTALDHQKRGLMQQLLTGRIRVAAP